MDSGVFSWLLFVTKGSWQITNREEIAGPIQIINSTQAISRDPYQEVAVVMNKLNDQLKAYFGDSPIPTTWVEKVEDAIGNLLLFLQGDIPQIKNG
jgi:hypothetical protein